MGASRQAGRVARLEAAAAAPPASGLARHWAREWAAREAGFLDFMAALPATHAGRVLAAVGGPEGVAGWLYAEGPAWVPADAPTVARWCWARAAWGAGHPLNPPLPAPVPGPYLDLVLAHPGAGMLDGLCRGCRLPVPHAPAEGVGDDPRPYRPPRPVAAACPACGAPAPRPRVC